MAVKPKLMLVAIALTYISLCTAYSYFALLSTCYDVYGDASGYLLAAQYFSPFQPVTPAIAAYSQQIIYPPLFPIVIGLAGGTAFSGSAVVLAAFFISITILFSWLIKERVGITSATLTCLLFALMPGTYTLALNIWTENVYLLLSLLSILAVINAVRANNDTTAVRFWWLAACAVSLATLTRVAALPLLGAFGLYLLIRRPRNFLLFGVCAALPFFTWAIVVKTTQAGLGGYTRQWAALYQTGFWEVFSSSASSWAIVLSHNWVGAFVGGTSSTLLICIAAGIGFAGLIGLGARLRRLEFDAIYVLLYLLMLLAWPHSEEGARYSYVLVPILLVYAVITIQRACTAVAPLKGGMPSVVVLIISLVAILPSLAINISRYTKPLAPVLEPVKHMDGWYSDIRDERELWTPTFLALLQDMQTVADYVPPQDCIYSIKPTMVTYQTGRTSYAPPPSASSDEEFALGMRRCRFAYTMILNSASYNDTMYPLSRLGAGARVISRSTRPAAQKALPVGILVELRGQ